MDQIENTTSEYELFFESVRSGGQFLPQDLEPLDRLAWADNINSADDARSIASSRTRALFSKCPSSARLTPDMAESILLLSWRHLLFYANDAKESSVRPDNLSLSLSYSTMDASKSKGQALRSLTNSAAELRGVLERLDDLIIVSPTTSSCSFLVDWCSAA